MLVEQRKEPRTGPEFVNIGDPGQRSLWCQRLECSEQELCAGVRAAGVLVERLRLHLRIRRSVRAAIRYGRVFGAS